MPHQGLGIDGDRYFCQGKIISAHQRNAQGWQITPFPSFCLLSESGVTAQGLQLLEAMRSTGVRTGTSPISILPPK